MVVPKAPEHTNGNQYAWIVLDKARIPEGHLLNLQEEGWILRQTTSDVHVLCKSKASLNIPCEPAQPIRAEHDDEGEYMWDERTSDATGDSFIFMQKEGWTMTFINFNQFFPRMTFRKRRAQDQAPCLHVEDSEEEGEEHDDDEDGEHSDDQDGEHSDVNAIVSYQQGKLIPMTEEEKAEVQRVGLMGSKTDESE